MGVSVAIHAGFLLLIVFVLAVTPKDTLNNLQNQVIKMVYLEQPGPGGGGGGSPQPAPPKQMSIPPHKTPDIPVVPPPVVPPPVAPPPMRNAPVVTPDANLIQANGASSVSLAAYGGGGRGGGIGSGNGNGVGPGEGGGFGGGAFRPGNGINGPSVLKKVNPAYTAEAMRNKITGLATVEAVVQADGTVGQVRIVKSLDKTYGLDEAALAAAKQWLFIPAVDRDGKKVPVLVTIELQFTLH
jgi:TonB family protein